MPPRPLRGAVQLVLALVGVTERADHARRRSSNHGRRAKIDAWCTYDEIKRGGSRARCFIGVVPATSVTGVAERSDTRTAAPPSRCPIFDCGAAALRSCRAAQLSASPWARGSRPWPG